jgi:IPT/TIG domain
MPKRLLLILCILAGGTILLPASAATTPAPLDGPVITKVTPKRLGIGDILTIRGHNFVPGLNTNTVVFQRAGARPVFIRADRADRAMIQIRISCKLRPVLLQTNGRPQATQFRLRVLGGKLSAFTTPKTLSPTIGPKRLHRTTLPPPSRSSEGDCRPPATVG